jgi:hypothetical protein
VHYFKSFTSFFNWNETTKGTCKKIHSLMFSDLCIRSWGYCCKVLADLCSAK